MIVFAIIISTVIILCFAFDQSLTVRYYNIESNKINTNIRIAFVADLHSCDYGKNQKNLLDCIDNQKPDILLFGGDIFDESLPYENSIIVLKSVAEKYPCYYVSGNHEYRTGDIDSIKQMISGYGIIILEGQSKTVMIKGQAINICGVDDADVGHNNFMKQIVNAGSQVDTHLFTIFMAHRPEYIETYLKYNFDLILSGHAHGGQWRIPGIINGLLAPNQGFFPKYAGGEYEFNDKTFIVSRGLAKESTRVPRIFNPPELVIIDVVSIK
ncbi:metallophosphoesterase [Anaerovorax odorimutans]|uniref:metallophosphoesterase n=1 Tax=Anaerovorax odorimutans TaxID=109327 RepID=UPI00041AC5B1|nr:metallophosphoesterase [Anaerovorax odorimutans]